MIFLPFYFTNIFVGTTCVPTQQQLKEIKLPKHSHIWNSSESTLSLVQKPINYFSLIDNSFKTLG